MNKWPSTGLEIWEDEWQRVSKPAPESKPKSDHELWLERIGISV